MAVGFGRRQFSVGNSALTCLAINLPASVISFRRHECLQSKHGYSLISKKQAHRYNSVEWAESQHFPAVLCLFSEVLGLVAIYWRIPNRRTPFFSHSRIKLGRCVISCCCFNFSTSRCVLLGFFYVCFKWRREMRCKCREGGRRQAASRGGRIKFQIKYEKAS